LEQIEAAWKEQTIVWLAGVRRVGKTVLSQLLPNVKYYDCELPRTRRLLEDPEGFLSEVRGKRIVLDEIHRLMNPSEIWSRSISGSNQKANKANQCTWQTALLICRLAKEDRPWILSR